MNIVRRSLVCPFLGPKSLNAHTGASQSLAPAPIWDKLCFSSSCWTWTCLQKEISGALPGTFRRNKSTDISKRRNPSSSWTLKLLIWDFYRLIKLTKMSFGQFTTCTYFSKDSLIFIFMEGCKYNFGAGKTKGIVQRHGPSLQVQQLLL